MRIEFIELVKRPGITMAEACRQYGIRRKTGYKWLNRYAEMGVAGLEEQSKRPHSQPNKLRPHQALNGDTPSQHYRRSPRKYTGSLMEFDYKEMTTRKIDKHGDLKWHSMDYFLSEALRGERVGMKRRLPRSSKRETGRGLSGLDPSKRQKSGSLSNLPCGVRMQAVPLRPRPTGSDFPPPVSRKLPLTCSARCL